jgi:hypothetical protein
MDRLILFIPKTLISIQTCREIILLKDGITIYRKQFSLLIDTTKPNHTRANEGVAPLSQSTFTKVTTMTMLKIHMIEIALANLVASESAEIVGMGWQIELSSGNTLFIEPSDEGFVHQLLYKATDEHKEHFGDWLTLERVSRLTELINEVDEDE